MLLHIVYYTILIILYHVQLHNRSSHAPFQKFPQTFQTVSMNAEVSTHTRLSEQMSPRTANIRSINVIWFVRYIPRFDRLCFLYGSEWPFRPARYRTTDCFRWAFYRVRNIELTFSGRFSILISGHFDAQRLCNCNATRTQWRNLWEIPACNTTPLSTALIPCMYDVNGRRMGPRCWNSRG